VDETGGAIPFGFGQEVAAGRLTRATYENGGALAMAQSSVGGPLYAG
jgi:hypothetical protein